MPNESPSISRAELIEIEYDKDQGSYEKTGAKSVAVQFNPQSLKVNYKNQQAGKGKQGTSGVQYVGTGSTSLSVDLLFDVTRPTGKQSDTSDVRYLTEEVNYFMRDLKKEKEGKYSPPGVRFLWGSFLFDGVMDSMSETLEFFDPEGRPLRATVSISLSKQEIQFVRPESGPGPRSAEQEGGGTAAEERPPGAENTSGKPLQQIAAERGQQDNWKETARKNDVENPRAIHNPNALNF